MIESLKYFDELPAAGFVRLPVVAALFACSKPTVWRRVRAGLIPKPRKLGPRVTGWQVGELRQALGGEHAG